MLIENEYNDLGLVVRKAIERVCDSCLITSAGY